MAKKDKRPQNQQRTIHIGTDDVLPHGAKNIEFCGTTPLVKCETCPKSFIECPIALSLRKIVTTNAGIGKLAPNNVTKDVTSLRLRLTPSVSEEVVQDVYKTVQQAAKGCQFCGSVQPSNTILSR